MITSYAVRLNQSYVNLAIIDKIQVINRHSQSQGKGVTYSVGTGVRGDPRMHISQGGSKSIRYGDIVFLSNGGSKVEFTVYEVEDPSGIVGLVKSANPRIK